MIEFFCMIGLFICGVAVGVTWSIRTWDKANELFNLTMKHRKEIEDLLRVRELPRG